MDPQGNATTGLGASNKDANKNIYKVIIGQNNPENCIQSSCVKNLDLIGSNVNLSGSEIETANNPSRAFLLKEILKKNKDLFSKYENIFIDCPPSLSLLTVMSLVVADEILVPLQTEFYALEGLTQLIKTLDLVQHNFNQDIKLQGILLTMYDTRNKISEMVSNDVKKHFGDKVFKTIIPRNVRVSEAPSFGQPVLMYDINCPGSQAYAALAGDIINQEKVL